MAIDSRRRHFSPGLVEGSLEGHREDPSGRFARRAIRDGDAPWKWKDDASGERLYMGHPDGPPRFRLPDRLG